jgi:hypothetical protein
MSQEMKNRINELQRFQAIISKKLLNKFGINDTERIDEWGWFIDPEINYFKKQIVTQFSIPTTIQEEIPKIRSIKSINHFTNEFVFNEQTATATATETETTSYFIILVKLITVLSLSYILIVL